MTAKVESVRAEAQAYLKSYQWRCEADAETCKLSEQRAEQEVIRLQDEIENIQHDFAVCRQEHQGGRNEYVDTIRAQQMEKDELVRQLQDFNNELNDSKARAEVAENHAAAQDQIMKDAE